MIQGGDPQGDRHRQPGLRVRATSSSVADDGQARHPGDGQPRAGHQRLAVLHHREGDAVAQRQAHHLRAVRRRSISSSRSRACRRARNMPTDAVTMKKVPSRAATPKKAGGAKKAAKARADKRMIARALVLLLALAGCRGGGGRAALRGHAVQLFVSVVGGDGAGDRSVGGRGGHGHARRRHGERQRHRRAQEGGGRRRSRKRRPRGTARASRIARRGA